MEEQFVYTPNLPENRVKAVFLGEKYKNLASVLDKLGIISILLGANCVILPNLQYHADMSVFHAGYNRIILSKHVQGFDGLFDRLKKIGFEITVSEKPDSGKYPGDIGLNACLVGDLLFHKKGCTDANIVELAEKSCWKSIYINQGYAKCSICILDKRHIITSDMGIHKKALKAGLESLLISPGQIELDGFNEGFIGGASVKISKNQIAFTGTLKYHRDEKKILGFIKSVKMEPVFLTEDPIYDVGSIIPVIEAIN